MRSRNLKNLSVLLITLIISFSLYSFEILNIGNYWKWGKAKDLLAAGYVTEAQNAYSELYPLLSQDISFLKDYNLALEGTNGLQRRLKVLMDISGRYTDNLLYLDIGKVYEGLGRNYDAERSYLIAVNIVPNRFVPKNALVHFYLRTDQQEKVRYWSNQILSMPVKIPSDQIDRIKQNILQLATK